VISASIFAGSARGSVGRLSFDRVPVHDPIRHATAGRADDRNGTMAGFATRGRMK